MTATIRMTYRPDGHNPWLAEIKENPELHAVGLTQYEALGCLIIEFGQDIGITVIWPPEHERKWPDDLTPDDIDVDPFGEGVTLDDLKREAADQARDIAIMERRKEE